MLIVNAKNESLDYILNTRPVNEALFQNGDFNKHSYLKDVVNVILSGEPLRIGSKGEDEIVLSSKDIKSIKADLQNVTDVNTFNDILKPFGIRWTKIFKGTFSGYKDGLASKNKGNAFEDAFVANFEKYEPEIKKLVKYKELLGVRQDGGLNQKRPLTISGKTITCGPAGDYNIGKTVTDVTLETDKGPIYLSLKYGNTVTFVNAGIKRLFTKDFFNGGELSGEGETLLDMLCIDHDRFRNVFNAYKEPEQNAKKKKATKDTVNITSQLKSNAVFTDFMRSVIGYGFIMVHQTSNGSVEFIDFLTKSKLNGYIKNMNNAYVAYPKDGEAKRVDVIVEYDNIIIKLNIRSKDGGILPTHIMADYVFKK